MRKGSRDAANNPSEEGVNESLPLWWSMSLNIERHHHRAAAAGVVAAREDQLLRASASARLDLNRERRAHLGRPDGRGFAENR